MGGWCQAWRDVAVGSSSRLSQLCCGSTTCSSPTASLVAKPGIISRYFTLRRGLEVRLPPLTGESRAGWAGSKGSVCVLSHQLSPLCATPLASLALGAFQLSGFLVARGWLVS